MNEYERKASVLPRNLESSEGSNGVPQLKLIRAVNFAENTAQIHS